MAKFNGCLWNTKAIDIDVDKSEHFILKTGHKIGTPEMLTIYKPKRILVMNCMYIDEIRKMVLNMLPYNMPQILAAEQIIDEENNY